MNNFTQGLLRYLSAQQLKRIQSIKIAIGGAGGLGSNVAVILTRTGFAQFEIIDHDTVDPSNLNRQDFTLEDIGKPKVEALKSRILSINPDACVQIHHQTWDEKTSAGIFINSDFIVEAFDAAEMKTRFVNFYHHRAAYVISGNGMAGFNEPTGIGVRNVGNIYFIGDGITAVDHNHPPMAPRVMECASKMAGIILKLTA